jgi:hypothetical protein
MSSRWTVSQWELDHHGWHYVEVWAGRYFIGALIAAVKSKRDGTGCVKVEWR